MHEPDDAERRLEALRAQIRALEEERRRMRTWTTAGEPPRSAWRRPVPAGQLLGLLVFATSLAAIILSLRAWLLDPVPEHGPERDLLADARPPDAPPPEGTGPTADENAPTPEPELAEGGGEGEPAHDVDGEGGRRPARPARPARPVRSTPPSPSDGLPDLDQVGDDPLGGIGGS